MDFPNWARMTQNKTVSRFKKIRQLILRMGRDRFVLGPFGRCALHQASFANALNDPIGIIHLLVHFAPVLTCLNFRALFANMRTDLMICKGNSNMR